MHEHQHHLHEASRLDQAGLLDQAHGKVHDFNSTHAADTRAAVKIESFLMETAILRHRDDVASLNRARELAAQSHRLSQLPAFDGSDQLRARAALEFAACALAAGHTDEALAVAQRWTNHQEPGLAGRAWAMIGETQLAAECYAEALAPLLNAVADYARSGDDVSRLQVRISVAAALSRNGRLGDAAIVLDEDKAAWVESDQKRLAVEYRLVLAENLRRQGFLREAIAVLDAARTLLRGSTGMKAATVRVGLQRAESLMEWGQVSDAGEALRRASTTLERIAVPEQPVVRPDPVPRPALAQQVNLASGQRMARGLHTRLLQRAVELEARLVRLGEQKKPRPRRSLHRRDLKVSDVVAEVRSIIDTAKLGGVKSDESVGFLVSQVERLQSLPGQDGVEATALVEAGSVLREAPGTGPAASERLIRRAQARLAFLEGMGIWRARADVELARTLKDTKRVREALSFAVSGVQELDRQRHRMDRRDHRRTWLAQEIHPAIDLAIGLALERGEKSLAADLIVFSRAAGVVVAQAPDQTQGELSDVPLLPVPRLRYIDGRTSELGSDKLCRFC